MSESNLSLAVYDVIVNREENAAIIEIGIDNNKIIYKLKLTDDCEDVELRTFNNTASEVITVSGISLYRFNSEEDLSTILSLHGINSFNQVFSLENLYSWDEAQINDEKMILKPNLIQFGSYCNLQAKQYTVVIKGSDLLDAEYDVLIGDMDSDSDFSITEKQHTDDIIEYDIEFCKAYSSIEFRTFNNTNENIAINSITVLITCLHKKMWYNRII